MRKLSFRKKLLICAALVLLVLILWTLWGNTALTVSRISIRGPSELEGLCIAHISDLHNAEFGEGNAELLKLLAEIEPDLIAVTGDLVDSRHTDMDIALEFMRGAVKTAPAYYVPGNHEARLSEYGELRDGLEAAGVTVLEDRAVSPKGYARVNIIGLAAISSVKLRLWRAQRFQGLWTPIAIISYSPTARSFLTLTPPAV